MESLECVWRIENSKEIKSSNNSNDLIEFLSFLNFVGWITKLFFKNWCIFFYKFLKFWGKNEYYIWIKIEILYKLRDYFAIFKNQFENF